MYGYGGLIRRTDNGGVASAGESTSLPEGLALLPGYLTAHLQLALVALLLGAQTTVHQRERTPAGTDRAPPDQTLWWWLG